MQTKTKTKTAEKMRHKPMEKLPYGAVFTIEGFYKKRSFIEWVFNKPKKLYRFVNVYKDGEMQTETKTSPT